ncbi:MBL fold metallo-hydrolase [Chitinophaga agrisoli]|uniref:MBL fold metallo-hydrolase n=2 Tax=Chitinophaga agrisoli TaxID=2607653 RepID=A0A5B2VXU6_9BACT|nr:MBL fold metallo-hydrolase [Chitinophaga agrisoli]
MFLAIGLISSSTLQACKSDDNDPKPHEPAPLQLQVITASPEGFQVNSTLITGEKDAVLIDAQFTISDADKLVKIIQDTKKNLTTIYITHSHADHYFGLVQLKKAFPNAKIVALAATVADIQKKWKDQLAQWQPLFGDGITANPIIPDVLTGTTLTLENETFQITGGLQGDEAGNSYVWIPSLKAVVCGDTNYNGVFPWTIETTPEQRKGWISTINTIAALKPALVVAGHKNPTAKDDAASLDLTKGYLAFYDSVLPTATSSADFQTKIKAQYPNLQLPIILQLAADAAF